MSTDGSKKTPGEIPEKPKLKKIKSETTAESPLEKLKRLENGERQYSVQYSTVQYLT